MTTPTEPDLLNSLDTEISKLLVHRLEEFMAQPDIVTFAGELTMGITDLVASHIAQAVQEARIDQLKRITADDGATVWISLGDSADDDLRISEYLAALQEQGGEG